MDSKKLAEIPRYTGDSISNIYSFQSEEFFLVGDVKSALATTSTEPAKEAAKSGDAASDVMPRFAAPASQHDLSLPHKRYVHVNGFSDGTEYVEFLAGSKDGFAFKDGPLCNYAYGREQVAGFVRDGDWIELPIVAASEASASPVPRAQGGNTQATRDQIIEASGNAILAGEKPGSIEYDVALVRNLEAALCTPPAPSASASPAAPRAPEKLTMSMVATLDYLKGWNACVDAFAASPAAAVAAPVAGSQQVPEAWRSTLENIAAWLANSVTMAQNAPDDYGPATEFDYQLGQAAAEISQLLAAAAPAVPVPADQDQARDAARYRWLRDRKAPASFWPIPSLVTQDWQPTPLELDAAVDAAMAAPSLQQPKEGAAS